MHAALTRLAEPDPLINLRHDDVRGETHVSLYGEVQKEVIAAHLATEYGVLARSGDDGHLPRAGHRVGCRCRDHRRGAEPVPRDRRAAGGRRRRRAAACAFALEVELGLDAGVVLHGRRGHRPRDAGQGLHGWPVPDCVVTMTPSGYYPRQSHVHQKFDKSMSSTAGDFRRLTPLVLMEALRLAGTAVEEPVHRFDLELPSDALGSALTMLGHLRATPRKTTCSGR